MQDYVLNKKPEPAEMVWAFDLGHPLHLKRCPSLAGAGEDVRRTGEGHWGNGTWAKFRANYVGVVAGMTRRFLDFSEKYGVLEREANIIADLEFVRGCRLPCLRNSLFVSK